MDRPPVRIERFRPVAVHRGRAEFRFGRVAAAAPCPERKPHGGTLRKRPSFDAEKSVPPSSAEGSPHSNRRKANAGPFRPTPLGSGKRTAGVLFRPERTLVPDAHRRVRPFAGRSFGGGFVNIENKLYICVFDPFIAIDFRPLRFTETIGRPKAGLLRVPLYTHIFRWK